MWSWDFCNEGLQKNWNPLKKKTILRRPNNRDCSRKHVSFRHFIKYWNAMVNGYSEIPSIFCSVACCANVRKELAFTYKNKIKKQFGPSSWFKIS
jgi:hypothetical protein